MKCNISLHWTAVCLSSVSTVMSLERRFLFFFFSQSTSQCTKWITDKFFARNMITTNDNWVQLDDTCQCEDALTQYPLSSLFLTLILDVLDDTCISECQRERERENRITQLLQYPVSDDSIVNESNSGHTRWEHFSSISRKQQLHITR